MGKSTISMAMFNSYVKLPEVQRMKYVNRSGCYPYEALLGLSLRGKCGPPRHSDWQQLHFYD